MRWTPIAWGCFHVFARGRHYFSWTSGESSPGVPVISPGTTGEPPPLGPLLPLTYHRNTFACGVIAYLPGVAMHPRLGSVLSLPQTTRYKIGCAVIRTTWAGGKPLTICMVPARHQRLYPESPHGHHTREGRGAVQYQAPRGTYHRQSVMQCTHQSCSTYTPAGTSTFF